MGWLRVSMPTRKFLSVYFWWNSLAELAEFHRGFDLVLPSISVYHVEEINASSHASWAACFPGSAAQCRNGDVVPQPPPMQPVIHHHTAPAACDCQDDTQTEQPVMNKSIWPWDTFDAQNCAAAQSEPDYITDQPLESARGALFSVRSESQTIHGRSPAWQSVACRTAGPAIFRKTCQFRKHLCDYGVA